MKSVIASFFVLAAFGAFAQGTINFHNRWMVSGINAPISYEPGGPAPSGLVDGNTAIEIGGCVWGGVNARAGLYAGSDGCSEEQLVLLQPAVGFNTGVAAGLVAVGVYGSRFVPNVPPGAPAVFQVRAWDAGVPDVDSYEEAWEISQTRFVYLGKSEVVNVAALGAIGAPPSIPADLIGLQPFHSREQAKFMLQSLRPWASV